MYRRGRGIRPTLAKARKTCPTCFDRDVLRLQCPTCGGEGRVPPVEKAPGEIADSRTALVVQIRPRCYLADDVRAVTVTDPREAMWWWHSVEAHRVAELFGGEVMTLNIRVIKST